MICPNCRKENPAGSPHCAFCLQMFGKPALAAAAPRRGTLKIVIVVLAALAALVLALRKPPKADSFTVTDLQGRKMRLSECEGRPVFLYVWETNSPRAVENLGMIDALYGEFKGTPVCFMTVTIDEHYEGTVRPFAARHGIRYPVFNGTGYIAGQFWPPAIPTLYLIDRDMRVRESFSPSRDDRAKIEARMKKYSKGGSDAEWVDRPDGPPDLSDSPEGSDALTAKARALLEDQRFDELDALAADLRANKRRFASGRWKLGAFYEGLEAFSDPRVSDAQWKRRLTLLSRWKEFRPASITAPVALGGGLAGYAWYARSGAAARDVAAEDMSLFQRRLAEARAVLDPAAARTSRCPHVYVALMSAAVGQSLPREGFEALFAKAVKFEPGYDEYYVVKARYLSPVWHGELGEWEEFAEEAGRGHPDLYARIALGMARGNGKLYGRFGIDLLRRSAITWPKLRDGMLEIDRMYPGGRENLNRLAWFAYQTNDHEAAKPVFERIGDRYDKNLWRSRAAFARARSWAVKHTLIDRFSRLTAR